jgi:hypothetical protein
MAAGGDADLSLVDEGPEGPGRRREGQIGTRKHHKGIVPAKLRSTATGS